MNNEHVLAIMPMIWDNEFNDKEKQNLIEQACIKSVEDYKQQKPPQLFQLYDKDGNELGLYSVPMDHAGQFQRIIADEENNANRLDIAGDELQNIVEEALLQKYEIERVHADDVTSKLML